MLLFGQRLQLWQQWRLKKRVKFCGTFKRLAPTSFCWSLLQLVLMMEQQVSTYLLLWCSSSDLLASPPTPSLSLLWSSPERGRGSLVGRGEWVVQSHWSRGEGDHRNLLSSLVVVSCHTRTPAPCRQEGSLDAPPPSTAETLLLLHSH